MLTKICVRLSAPTATLVARCFAIYLNDLRRREFTGVVVASYGASLQGLTFLGVPSQKAVYAAATIAAAVAIAYIRNPKTLDWQKPAP